MVWSTSDIGDLSGTRALVTGVTGGLGFQTALGLARHGASLVVTARDADKAAATVRTIEGEVPGASVDLLLLDLADLSSVRHAAARALDSYDGFDLLINNAGIMATPDRRTADGFEMQIGTNHLGHFALTAHLWPALVARCARIVTVSSLFHSTVNGIDLRSLTADGAQRRYSRWRSYGESKLANLSFAIELDRRIHRAGLGMTSVAAHPGYSATNLYATGPRLGVRSPLSLGMHQISRIVAQPAHAGAWPTLMAATMPGLAGGSYVGPNGLGELRGRPQLVAMSAAARDEQLATALWEASERATGVRFDLA